MPVVQIKTSPDLKYKPTMAFIRSIPTLLRVAGGLPKIILRNWSLKRVEIPVVGISVEASTLSELIGIL